MSLTELKEIAAILGPLVALVSIGVNVYLFRNPPTRRSQVAKLDEIRPLLQKLVTKIDKSRLSSIQPNSENWMYGFPSIKEFHDLAAEANTAVDSADPRHVPYEIKTAVAGIFTRTKALYWYGDSFSNFAQGREFIPRPEYNQWQDKGQAENILHDLQLYLPSKRDALGKFLAELGKH